MEDASDMAPVNILVVDDRPENTLAIKGVLNDPSYNVVTAASGAEALKRVLKHEFAVVLLDVLMPSMDGFETARLIHDRDASKHVPIIFLTAAGSDLKSVDRGYSTGAVDYLVKPIDADIVRAKVSVFVDLFRKARRIQRQEQELRRAEQERSAEALRQREAEYEATFEQAASGIAHVGIDGQCLRVNRRFCDILGYSKEEFLKQTFQRLSLPEESREHEKAFGDVAAGRLDSFRGEQRFVHTGGRTVWLDMTISVLRDAGRPTRFILVAEDATERKRAEAAQRALANASKSLLHSLDFRTTLDGLAESIVPMLSDFCVVEARPDTGAAPVVTSAQADPERAALVRELGIRWSDIVRAGLPSAGTRRKAVVISDVTEAVVDGWRQTPSNRELLGALGIRSMIGVPIAIRGVPYGSITLFSSDPSRRYGTSDLPLLEDLADRAALGIENARLYKAAQDAIGARDEFLSIASHELRTPLTPLQIQLQRLLGLRGEDAFADMPRDQLRGILKRSTLQVGRLAALIDTLLDVSRIGSGKLALEPALVDLSAIARDVVERFGAASNGSGSTVAVVAETRVKCRCDSLRVEQVLTNLLANAIKYGSGKPVEVRVRSEGDFGVLEVEDHGIGVPEEKQAIIFNRFERGDSARAYGGLGLGLYIARCIVQAHGGTIGVRSTPNAGSTFTVQFPMAGENRRTPKPNALLAAGDTSAARHSRSVLVVDDDSDIRECLADLLEEEGYDVAVAENGQEALDRLEGGSPMPDVIVLDLMMPVLDGAGFRTEQQKRPALAGIPVVVVSGDGSSDDKALSLRAAGCLKKPVDVDELLKLVEHVSRKSPASTPRPIANSS